MSFQHILIVEDSLTQAVKLEYFLFEKGYRVTLASDGEKALNALDRKDIDLVISDIVMPGMDGYELCENIRNNPKYKAVPVILLTSLSEPGDIIKGLKSGATNFVTKPYDEDFLLSRIQSVFKHGELDSYQSAMQEVDFEFQGEDHSLKADFGQVFHLLLATYENTLLQSRQIDEANRKLIAREEQLSSVLASMSAKIAVLDTDTKLIVANESWRELFTPERFEVKLEGLDFKEAVAGSGCLVKDLDALFEGVSSVARGVTDSYSLEFAVDGKHEGESFWNMLEVTPMRGGLGGAVASFIDITGRKEMEHELIKARDTAEKGNRFKSRFLASMSHEIRTPLNGVIGMTDLTLRSDLTADQAENLEIVRTSANQLLTLINDILDLSKVEARMLTLEEKDFHLSKSLGEIIKIMTPQAAERGLVLSLDIDSNVHDIVCGDEGRLRQIFFNLVGNSLKFTEQGGVFVQVSALDSSDDSDCSVLQVSVRDTGIGIPEAKQALIFESFRQADDSTTRKFGGSGLGLAISRELVEMMGGEISVRSSEGYGSVFTFSVSLKRGTLENIALKYAEAENFNASNDERPCRILVVEDNPINVKVATSLLKKMGHSVHVASNGLEALSSLSVLDVDLVLMDLEMPKMDGFNAAKSIRQGDSGHFKQNIPIIAMSAHAMAGVRDKCENYGMNGYIAKPVQYTELHDAILQAVNMNKRVSQFQEELNKKTKAAINRENALEMYQGDELLFRDICEMLVTDVPSDLVIFQEALENNDAEIAKRTVHTLKSSCAAVCADRACYIATMLEKALLRGELGQVQGYIAEFLKEFSRIEAELKI
ncbi:MAG: histidine kinase [Desulfovibrio sp. S3730MH75]|nr:MAG: histidine kinase [Desulfovibrio sp. S3730MH75]